MKQIEHDLPTAQRTAVPLEYISTPAMKAEGFHVHKDLHFIYCEYCQLGILFQRFNQHQAHYRHEAKDKLIAPVMQRECRSLGITELDDLDNPRIAKYSNMTGKHAPIAGIPLKSGFQCRDCNKCLGTKESMISHVKRDHKPRGTYGPAVVQRIYFNQPYFPVEQTGTITLSAILTAYSRGK